MTSPPPVFELDQISFSYPSAPVFEGLSLCVRAGESLAIIGPGAAGKSTLLKVMVGLLPPVSGRVRWKGRDFESLSRSERVGAARQMGVCLQNGGLFDSRDCAENLSFVLREHTDLSEAAIRERVAGALSDVGLSGNEKTFVHELSGGMRKRLGIARAFLLKPEVVLLDDPTAGLDPITSRQIIDLIVEFKDQRALTLVVVTSDPPRAFEVADTVLLLESGRITEQGPGPDLRQRPAGPVHNFLRGIG